MLSQALHFIGQLVRNLERNHMNAVTIAMQKVPGGDCESPQVDRFTEFDDMSVGVRNAPPGRETLESGRSHSRQVPDGPVRHVAHATQSLSDPRMNLAQQGSRSRDTVDVRDCYDFRRWKGGGEMPPIGAVVVAQIRHGGRGSADTRRYRVSRNRRQLG